MSQYTSPAKPDNTGPPPLSANRNVSLKKHRNYTPLTARTSSRRNSRAEPPATARTAAKEEISRLANLSALGSGIAQRKEIEKLQYMNEYLQMALRKRDEVIAVALEENARLRDEISRLENEVKTRELRIEEVKMHYIPCEQKPELPKSARKPEAPRSLSEVKSRIRSDSVSTEARDVLKALKKNIVTADKQLTFLDPNGFSRVLLYGTVMPPTAADRLP